MSLEKSAEPFVAIQPIEFVSEQPDQSVIEVCAPEECEECEKHLEVSDEDRPSEEPIVVEVQIDANDLNLGKLPGAPDNCPDILEVIDESPVVEAPAQDDNDAKKTKKKDSKWDWHSRLSAPDGFVIWIKERFDDVPKHNGIDSAGVERALSYLEKLDSEISKAMRQDVDGELDANSVENIRAKIEDGINKLSDRLEKILKSKKKTKKRSDFIQNSLVKEAQKITGVQGVYVTVPLLISGIARVCINGVVSAGHDLSDMFERLCEKYKLNDREKSEVRWLLFDLGYPLRGDRGFMPDEEYDSTSSDNFDYAANYKA